MLRAQPRPIHIRHPRLIGALVTAGVLIGTGVVLPAAVGPLLHDGAFVEPGCALHSTPGAARDTVISQLTYRHCGEQHRETVLRP